MTCAICKEPIPADTLFYSVLNKGQVCSACIQPHKADITGLGTWRPTDLAPQGPAPLNYIDHVPERCSYPGCHTRVPLSQQCFSFPYTHPRYRIRWKLLGYKGDTIFCEKHAEWRSVLKFYRMLWDKLMANERKWDAVEADTPVIVPEAT